MAYTDDRYGASVHDPIQVGGGSVRRIDRLLPARQTMDDFLRCFFIGVDDCEPDIHAE